MKALEKPLEDLVKLLLPTQIDSNFHIECLKAQAVIIRNNLLRDPLKDKNLDLDDMRRNWEQVSQKNRIKIVKAVEGTEDLIVTFNGNPIEAYYHDNCGGSTENSEDVLNRCITYLRRVLCDYCKDSPNYLETKYYSIEDLEIILGEKMSKSDTCTGEISGFIKNIERDSQGRVIKLTIGTKEYSGTELMNLLNLNSTRFYISPLNIKITSIGSGHGLGFCQNGGNEMAKRGFLFNEILKYYYTGVEIERYSFPSIKKPLLGKRLILDPAHGGIDCGHIGKQGLKESQVVLKFSKVLKCKLESLGAMVYLTRDDDREVLINTRGEIASHIRPNFLISFHMNYFPNSNMRGCEIYYYRGDLESKRLGDVMLKNLEGEMNIVNKGVKEGNFSLFKNVGVNSLIVELGFLSNENEERNFNNDEYLSDMTEIIAKSILEYYEN